MLGWLQFGEATDRMRHVASGLLACWRPRANGLALHAGQEEEEVSIQRILDRHAGLDRLNAGHCHTSRGDAHAYLVAVSPRSAAPVSYTHLDVYKRQLLDVV